jgi:hypothetical protein
MTDQWFTLISVLSGAVVGGIINYAATSRAKNQEWRLEMARLRILERRKLYADFLALSQLLIAQAIDSKLSNASEISVVFNEQARIELVASDEVIASAKAICSCVLDSHARDPGKDKGNFYSLKSAFVTAVRKELDLLERPNNSFKPNPHQGGA